MIFCFCAVFSIFTETPLDLIWRILDIFFVVFHISLIIFNLSGWIWKRTRKLNLVILSLTGASWLFLGLIVGTLGYCPLTDWHFNVLEKLGKTNLPNSYIKYLVDRLTGLDISASIVDNVTLYAFIAALACSVIFNIKDFKTSRQGSEANQTITKS